MLAQDLAGDYFITTASGEIGLELRSEDAYRYSGFMTDEEGTRFPLQAQISPGGVLEGAISGKAGQMTFKAYSAGNALQFSLIPLNASGQPNPNNPIEFAMQRRLAAASPQPARVNTPAGGLTPRTPAPAATPPQQAFPSTPPPPANSMGGPLAGQSSTPAATWSGAYQGNVNGTSSTLNLQQQGTMLSGDINAGGYRYKLQGNAMGTQFTGKLTDPQTGAILGCSGVMENGRLAMTVLVKDPNTGLSQPMNLQFTKRPAGPGGPLQANPGMSADIGVRGGMPQLDARLVGTWLYSAYNATGQYSLILQADGTYLYGNGAAAGGYNRGQWKTENNSIYINEGMGWRPYAGYYLEGANLMLKFADGNQQVWKRN